MAIAGHGNPRYCDTVMFVALLSTALALGGALAHLLELPNKIGLPRDDYFTVQHIYDGWNQLAYVLGFQFLSILASISLSRGSRRILWPVIIALAFLVAAQGVFWVFTYPANAATANWTEIPLDWEHWRRQWEYSHAVGAVFQLGSFCALAVAALARARGMEARAAVTESHPAPSLLP